MIDLTSTIKVNVSNNTKETKPSKKLLEALQELDYMELHLEEYKSYNNIEVQKIALS